MALKFLRFFRRHIVLLLFLYLVSLLASHMIEVRVPLWPWSLLEWDRTPPLHRAGGLAYREAGDPEAETLLLLHGSPGSSADFTNLMARLSNHYHCLAPDLPGYGESPFPVENYSLPALARTLGKFLKAKGVREAQVFGYSYGSGPALQLAADRPDLVRSLILYGGIGIQEGEGSGSYTLEHIKYIVGYVPVVVLPELIPHFGLLGSFKHRVAFLFSFIDLDQRPLRELMENLEQPVLILHGDRDPLVPLATAREHHRILKKSKLVIFPASHFMVFYPDGADRLAHRMDEFLKSLKAETFREEVVDMGRKPFQLPVEIPVKRGEDPWIILVTILLATFVSEDLTIVSTGLLIGDGRLDLFLGVLSCFLGIFAGDLGLWFIGRSLHTPLKKISFLQFRHLQDRLERTEHYFRKHGGKTLFASRFLPGTRFLVFTGSGLARMPFWKVAFWALLAGAIWAPLLIFLSAGIGLPFAHLVTGVFHTGIWGIAIAILLTFAFARFLVKLFSEEGRTDIANGFRKLRSPEFWPLFLFYLPTFLYAIYLSLRYRSATLFTVANPGIPQGGVVGESKSEILAKIPEEIALACTRLSTYESVEGKIEKIESFLQKRSLDYPVILKPDAAQRGAAVRLVKSREQARRILEDSRVPLIAQVYHPGPLEAGILYYRLPGEDRGSIFSITDKVFPEIEGDGVSTLKHLILSHPRYRLQYRIFRERFEDRWESVLERGEKIRLTVAGNHAQGTLFRDGAHLITPELTRSLDRIADFMDGFFIGRFDIRYESEEDLKQGKELAIVELNGSLGESTNIYDPEGTLAFLFGTQFRHLELLWKIGDLNRSRGHRPDSLYRVLAGIWQYYRKNRIDPVSD